MTSKQVSYEEFKLQFNNMYEKYERRRADNLTDPEERLQKPISTISGWEKQSQKSDQNSQSSIDMNEASKEVEPEEEEIEEEEEIDLNEEEVEEVEEDIPETVNGDATDLILLNAGGVRTKLDWVVTRAPCRPLQLEWLRAPLELPTQRPAPRPWLCPCGTAPETNKSLA